MAETGIYDGKVIVATTSDHVAPGPPALCAASPPPPPPPPNAVPWIPGPFLFVCKSKNAQKGTCSPDVYTHDGGRILVTNSAMPVEDPGNLPCKPSDTVPAPNKNDFVSTALCGIGFVKSPTGSKTKSGTKNIAVTTDQVFLNVVGENRLLHQCQGPLLTAGMLVGLSDEQKQALVTLIASGDPVAVATGDVIDEVPDLILPGAFQLAFVRHYASSMQGASGDMGARWVHSFEQWVGVDGDDVVLHGERGETIRWKGAAISEHGIDRARRLELRGKGRSYDVIDLASGISRELRVVTKGGRALLRALRDRRGHRVELVYQDEVLSRIVDTAGREIRIARDGSRRIVSLSVWARGAEHLATRYEYDSAGRLLAATDPAGRTTRYQYDSRHRLTAKSLPWGTTFRYLYDERKDRCIRSQADGGLQRVELNYDQTKRVTNVTGNPEPTEFLFDENGDLLEKRLQDGSRLLRQTRDADRVVVSNENAAGEITVYDVGARGEFLSVTGADGAKEEFEWRDDRVVSETYADGSRRQLAWDHNGNHLSTVDRTGRRTSASYDSRGRLTELSKEGHTLIHYTWDDEHNVATASDGKGVWRYQHDALGRLIRQTDPMGGVTAYVLDSLGRPTEVTMPDGAVVRYHHGLHDDPIRTEDSQGGSTESQYGGTGRLLRRTNSAGETWEFRRDRLERLRELVNPRKEIHSFQYDATGRLSEERTFDGQRIRYQYSRSNLLRRIDYQDETHVELLMDVRGRLLQRKTPHSSVKAKYDDVAGTMSLLHIEHDGEVELERVLDPEGRVLRETVDGRTIAYEYDGRGDVIKRTLPTGTETRYTRDVTGRVVAIEHAGELVTSERDALGREIRRHVRSSGLTLHRAWNATSQMTELSAHAASWGTTPIVQRTWEYGPHARLRRAQDSAWGAASYQHDAMGRLLVYESPRRSQSFAYDETGSVCASGGRHWQLRKGNVLVEAGGVQFENDSRGRRRTKIDTDGRVTEYLWDCDERLREVRLPDGTEVKFRYDALGRRIYKRVLSPPAPDSPLDPPTLRRVTYVWDGDELAMEIDSERGVREFVHEPTTFEPVVQRQNGEVFAFILDPLGFPRELVDGAGRIAWRGCAGPWGDIEAELFDEARPVDLRPVVSFRGLGHYADEETKLHATRFRMFDPATARWLSADPIRLDGGDNLFAFGGSPVTRVDPLGLMTRTQLQSFLESTRQSRMDANAGSKANAPTYSASTQSTAVNGSNSCTARNGDGNHAETNAANGVGGMNGTSVGASKPHCADCTNNIIDNGGYPASPIKSYNTQSGGPWEPKPSQVNADGGGPAFY